MKKFKRLTAGLLGAVMALSVCSFTAFAADPITTEAALKNAIENAGDGDTIVLDGDITLTNSLVIAGDRDITLDLGGYTLTGANGANILQFGYKNDEYKNTGSLTIENGKITGSGGLVNVFGKLRLEDRLKINVISTDFNMITSYGGTIEVNGAEMTAAGYGITLFNSYYVNGDGNNPNSNDAGGFGGSGYYSGATFFPMGNGGGGSSFISGYKGCDAIDINSTDFEMEILTNLMEYWNALLPFVMRVSGSSMYGHG